MHTSVDADSTHLRTGNVINLQWWLQCYAFDVIGSISVSSDSAYPSVGVPGDTAVELDDMANH